LLLLLLLLFVVVNPVKPQSATRDIRSPIARAIAGADDAALVEHVRPERKKRIAQLTVLLAAHADVPLSVAFHALVSHSGNVRATCAYLGLTNDDDDDGYECPEAWSVVEDQLICLTDGDTAPKAVAKLLKKRTREEVINRCEWMCVSPSIDL
jgi:hypothetical protein